MIARPAWREPMLWLVAGLPLASVVAGIWLLVIALRTGGDDAVDAQVQRRAQVQLSELGPDHVAMAGRFAVITRVTDDAVEVLPVSGDIAPAQSLLLTFNHPTDARRDTTLELAPSAVGWRAPARLPRDHDWNLRLQPADARWRLVGRMVAGSPTRLGPALAPD